MSHALRTSLFVGRGRSAADRAQRGEAAGTWCEAPLTVLMRGLPTSSAQWLWSQFTLADHAFVWLSKALYLILKFAVVHRQSFDDDIRSLPHIQACRKQTRANLEFVHKRPPNSITLRSQLGASLRKRNGYAHSLLRLNVTTPRHAGVDDDLFLPPPIDALWIKWCADSFAFALRKRCLLLCCINWPAIGARIH